jgi:hypothetical protein
MALVQLPPDFAASVRSLHRVAEQIVAPARKPDNEIALQATPGGFGTPPFEYQDIERQVRVDGVHLVDGERRALLESLESARAIVADLVPDQLDDSLLSIDPAAASALAAIYELGANVLQQLVDEAAKEDDAQPVILWPEHFDIATVIGDEDAGTRANYGFSPGDENHSEPYLYVGPWKAPPSGDIWNAQGFAGAELTYSELFAADDHEAAALDFLRTRRDALR